MSSAWRLDRHGGGVVQRCVACAMALRTVGRFGLYVVVDIGQRWHRRVIRRCVTSRASHIRGWYVVTWFDLYEPFREAAMAARAIATSGVNCVYHVVTCRCSSIRPRVESFEFW